VNDTIYAPATAPGRAAIAVIRISGPRAGEALDQLTGRTRPAPRRASLRKLRTAEGDPIDEALVLWLPGPDSYTGEDSAELHLHGGHAVTAAATAALSALGLRPAEAGELSRRAFENGRLDLAQAEAIADLVDAESEAQRRQALDQLSGALSARYAAWRSSLVEALAVLEAEIDFPDEDVPGGLAEQVRSPIERLLRELEDALEDARRGERVREGWRIAIVGAPNAGKSSLFNRLVRREAAIVTPEPGATRDVIEAVFTLAGFRALLADTAGLRAPSEPIEAEGVRRARAWAEGAAVRLWVVDAAGDEGAWHEGQDLVQDLDLLVLNKSDLWPGSDHDAASAWAAKRRIEAVEVSAETEAGLADLEARLERRICRALSGAEFPAVTRERHRLRLLEACNCLGRALEALGRGPELAAEDLRLAARALGRIAGRIDPEDVLDVIFASFCIGK
jgi:tRNA modification GTPase